MAQHLTDWGKEVKKRLVDLDKNQSWLMEEVRCRRNGIYIDSSLMHRLMTGKASSSATKETINEILEIKA